MDERTRKIEAEKIETGKSEAAQIETAQIETEKIETEKKPSRSRRRSKPVTVEQGEVPPIETVEQA